MTSLSVVTSSPSVFDLTHSDSPQSTPQPTHLERTPSSRSARPSVPVVVRRTSPCKRKLTSSPEEYSSSSSTTQASFASKKRMPLFKARFYTIDYVVLLYCGQPLISSPLLSRRNQTITHQCQETCHQRRWN